TPADWLQHDRIAATDRTIQEAVFDDNSTSPPVYKEAINSQANRTFHNGNSHSSQTTNISSSAESKLDSIPF
ncbi:MAG: hypothetical protein AB4038_18525, partial [Prochloraceae cyanobacterium]